MRITGGQWRSRSILMPPSEAVRPTQDRVREALFNLLMYVLPGARFLDLFAGSGATGLDALSRGASEATFLECDRTVFKTLLKNLAAFEVPATCAHLMDTMRWLMMPVSAPYDIVFADPPYQWSQAGGMEEVARLLVERGLLREGGTLVAETDCRTKAVEFSGYELVRDRLYGKTRLAVYRCHPALSQSSATV
ncbi:MAG: 16S rRNA (guanine(966)-N(2))-methyltransferase RsmD [Kiritimatiellia bacterium]